MSHTGIDESFLHRLPYRDGVYNLEYGRVTIDSRLEDALFGRSYLGFHTGLRVPVVVRVYPQEIRERPKEYDRFMDDVRRVARVRHPSIAGIYEVGEYLGHPFFIMEYVAGVPLAERIKALPLPEHHAVDLLLPLAEGLCELWRHGFVHRSFSPLYVCLPAEGAAKLDVKTILPRLPIDTASKRYLTPIMAPYWSPEEVSGNLRIDGRADMWSFGAVLYQAVTGRIPFVGDSLEQVLHRILNAEPADPLTVNPQINRELRDFLLRLLRKDPTNRFPTGEDFLHALRTIHRQMPRRIREEPSGFHPLSGRTEPIAPRETVRVRIPGDSSSRRDPSLPYREGDTIANCLLMSKIGEGPTGAMFRARHKALEIPVAVKLLPPDLAARDSIFLELFQRETRIAARIRHPNVTALYEAGCEDGQHYLVLEYMPGGTVKDRMALNGGKLESKEVARIMLGVARGLAAAEKVNVVHRNIKPDNIMFAENGDVKIADLGMATRVKAKNEDDLRASYMADQITHRMGRNPVSGAPAYMAPETALAPEKADIRADLYSLGVTAYCMLLGRLPFQGNSALELIMQHKTEKPIPPKEIEPRVSPALSGMIMRLLEKDPEARYPSAEALAEAIEQTSF